MIDVEIPERRMTVTWSLRRNTEGVSIRETRSPVGLHIPASRRTPVARGGLRGNEEFVRPLPADRRAVAYALDQTSVRAKASCPSRAALATFTS
jgi:hypothetical protein